MSKTMSAFRGSLDAYFQLYDSSGNVGPVYPVGNLTDFVITPDAEEVEIISTQNADFGQAADSMTDAKPTKCSFTVNRFNIDTQALANMGAISARTGVSATVTDEPVTCVKGEMLQLARLDISALTLSDGTGTTTYVSGTDYEIVDAALGLVKVLATGSIASGALLADYTAAAETGWLIEGGVDSAKFVRLFGRGVNRFNQKRSIVNITKGSIKPSGGFSRVGSDPASMGFDVTIITPADGSAPYTIIADD